MEEQNKKILLVEDDPNFGTVLKDYLMMNDYDVVHAKNGMEGFEKFKKDDYDLCILDVMMPYKDGFTLAKEIKKNTRRFAKRQLTWFKKDESIDWFDYNTDIKEIINCIENQL